MKTRCVFLLGLACLCIAGLPAQLSRSEAVARLAESLKTFAAAQHRPVLVTALGTIGYQETGFASAFSRWAEDLFTEAVAAAGGRFQLFASKTFKNLDPAFQKEYAGLFKAPMADAALIGKYSSGPDKVSLTADLIDLSNNLMLGRQELVLSRAGLPANLDMVPPRLEAALKVMGDIKDLLTDASTDLIVKASTSRGSGAAYRNGENMEIMFFTNKNAYVKLYHIDVDGRTQLIFPNKYHSNNLVPGNTVVTIPGPGYPFVFKMTPPFGAEIIKLVASSVQFKDVEESFKDLGEAAKGLLTRGLRVEERVGEMTETTVAYSIVGP